MNMDGSAADESAFFRRSIRVILNSKCIWTITTSEFSVYVEHDSVSDEVIERRFCETVLCVYEKEINLSEVKCVDDHTFLDLLNRVRACQATLMRAESYGIAGMDMCNLDTSEIRMCYDGIWAHQDPDPKKVSPKLIKLLSQIEEVRHTDEQLHGRDRLLESTIAELKRMQVSPFLIREVGRVLLSELRDGELDIIHMAMRMIGCADDIYGDLGWEVHTFNRKSYGTDYIRGLYFMKHIMNARRFSRQRNSEEVNIPGLVEMKSHNIIFIKTNHAIQTWDVIAPAVHDLIGSFCITQKNLILCGYDTNFATVMQNIIDDSANAQGSQNIPFIFVHPENMYYWNRQLFVDACMMRINDINDSSLPRFVIITSDNELIPGGIPERITISLSDEDVMRLCERRRQRLGTHEISVYKRVGFACEETDDGWIRIQDVQTGQKYTREVLDDKMRELPEFRDKFWQVEVGDGIYREYVMFMDAFWLALFYDGYMRSDGVIVPMRNSKKFLFGVPDFAESGIPRCLYVDGQYSGHNDITRDATLKVTKLRNRSTAWNWVTDIDHHEYSKTKAALETDYTKYSKSRIKEVSDYFGSFHRDWNSFLYRCHRIEYLRRANPVILTDHKDPYEFMCCFLQGQSDIDVIRYEQGYVAIDGDRVRVIHVNGHYLGTDNSSMKFVVFNSLEQFYADLGMSIFRDVPDEVIGIAVVRVKSEIPPEFMSDICNVLYACRVKPGVDENTVSEPYDRKSEINHLMFASEVPFINLRIFDGVERNFGSLEMFCDYFFSKREHAKKNLVVWYKSGEDPLPPMYRVIRDIPGTNAKVCTNCETDEIDMIFPIPVHWIGKVPVHAVLNDMEWTTGDQMVMYDQTMRQVLEVMIRAYYMPNIMECEENCVLITDYYSEHEHHVSIGSIFTCICFRSMIRDSLERRVKQIMVHHVMYGLVLHCPGDYIAIHEGRHSDVDQKLLYLIMHKSGEDKIVWNEAVIKEAYKVRNDIVEYIVNNWNDDFDNTGLLDFLRCIISPIQSRSIDLVRQEFIAAVRKVVPPYVLVCMKIFMNGVVFCDHKHLQEHIDKLFVVARKYPEFLPDFDEIKLFPAPSFMDRNPICYDLLLKPLTSICSDSDSTTLQKLEAYYQDIEPLISNLGDFSRWVRAYGIDWKRVSVLEIYKKKAASMLSSIHDILAAAKIV